MNIPFAKAMLLMAFVGFFSTVDVAQNTGTVSFDYDTNGNRISRSLLFSKDSRNGMESDSKFVNSMSDFFGEMSIRIYPNPTPDRFTMSVDGDHAVDAHAFLFTFEGVLLDEKTVKNGSVEFNLSGRSSGIYLLRLTLNGESKTWRVLKK